MTEKIFNVLFISTGNSARSILAEGLLNKLGEERFRGFSAGSNPSGVVRALALAELRRMDIPTEGLRSKSWAEFGATGAPEMDFVFTLCDQAAGEICPVWPGQPTAAHWGLPDPAAVEGDDATRAQAFRDAAQTIKRRIELMLSLPLAELDSLSIQRKVHTIGTMGPTTNVLILGTHNSARSVLAEGMLNHWAARFGKDIQAYSAGSAPNGRVNPQALEVLSRVGIDTTGYRSKSWVEFSGPNAPAMHIVITVCDGAAAEPCPQWPGSPVQVHWDCLDPAKAPDDQIVQAFELARRAIGYRVLQLALLPLETLSPAQLQRALEDIARN